MKVNALFVLGAAFAAALHAQGAQLILNGGFETPDTPTYVRIGAGQRTIAPWVVGLDSVEVGDAIGNGFLVGPAFEGGQYLDLTGTERGRISQTFATTPGLVYTLTFAYTDNYWEPSPPASARVRVFDGSGDRIHRTITHDGAMAGNYDWTIFNEQFTAVQGTTTLEFTSLTASPSGHSGGIMLDAVQVSEAAPAVVDVISDWNDTAIKVIKAAGLGAPATTRPLALVHVAQFDAVNAITGGFTPYLTSLAAPGASAEAAAAQAAYAVLKALFPTNTLPDATLAASLAPVPDGAAKANGIALGNATAAALLAVRAGDGFNASVNYTAPTPGPGLWEPRTNTALVTPQWRHVNPWTMRGASQFRADPPPALSSATYAADYNEIKSLGEANSPTRTAAQTDIALFHVEFQFFLSGYAARAALATHPLPLVQRARLFALIALAQADAAIAEWDTKYFYNFWRPQTAIRNGEADGNPDTAGDPNWTSLRPSPNHPEYAGAAAIAMTAATEVLAEVLGDETSFTIESPSLPGKPRTFARFSDLSTDAIDARVYIGFHFRHSSIVGATRGQLIARHVLRNFLLPVPSAVSAQAQAGGEFQLNLLTVGARPYVIEKSSDLVSWTPWKTNLTGLLSETDSANNAGGFYRARPK